MTPRRATGPRFCGWCANHNHRLCPGDCACADARDHRPGMTLAARMFSYVCPDLSGEPEPDRARRWREAA